MKASPLRCMWYSGKRAGVGCLDLVLALPDTGHLPIDKSLFLESSFLVYKNEEVGLGDNKLLHKLCARLS
jgi:hypothetical protein